MSNTSFLRAKGGIVDSADIVGCKVVNSQGENLGKIEGIMLDLLESRILYGVLSFGGFLGMGDKLFPVPVDALQWRVDAKGKLERCIVDIDKETLRSAPGYERNELPSTVDRSFATDVYAHYGYAPYWEM